MIMSIQPFDHGPLTNTNDEKTFLKDFLEIQKCSFQNIVCYNYLPSEFCVRFRILKTWFFRTTCLNTTASVFNHTIMRSKHVMFAVYTGNIFSETYRKSEASPSKLEEHLKNTLSKIMLTSYKRLGSDIANHFRVLHVCVWLKIWTCGWHCRPSGIEETFLQARNSELLETLKKSSLPIFLDGSLINDSMN